MQDALPRMTLKEVEADYRSQFPPEPEVEPVTVILLAVGFVLLIAATAMAIAARSRRTANAATPDATAPRTQEHSAMSLRRKVVVAGLLLTGAVIGCPQWDIHTNRGDVYRHGHEWLWSPPQPARTNRSETPKVNFEVLGLQVACTLVLTGAIALAVKDRKQ